MRKLVLTVLAALLVMGFAVNSGAAEKGMTDGQQHGCMHMSGNDGGCGCSKGSPMGMFKKLGLDDKQKEALREIHISTEKEMIKKRAEVQLAKIELREILSKDQVDLAAAESAVKKVESIKSEMKMLHIKAMEEIKSNLNADQKKQFVAMMRHMMMRHKMMRHGMMGHCGCSMHGKHPMHEKGKMKPDQK